MFIIINIVNAYNRFYIPFARCHCIKYISMFMLISTGNVYVCFVICHGVIILRHMFMVELGHLYNQV